MTEKEKAYHANIQRSLIQLYQRMTDLLDWMQDEQVIEEEQLTPEQLRSVQAVQAIEEEWMIDPDQREEYSLISWSE